jgi:hypothetical protein
MAVSRDRTTAKGSFRDSSSFGKRQEFVAIAELLKRGYDVYQTLVDDQGIDCVVRRERESIPRYVDLQVKSRSRDAVPRDWAFFNLGQVPNPRPNYLFMFFAERTGTYWIIPSLDLSMMAYTKKSGKHIGDKTIRLGNLGRGSFRPRPRFRPYEGDAGFAQLERAFDVVE